jgi:hypothetical protein
MENTDTPDVSPRRYPPGDYLVTRDPATVVGPTDLRAWVVTIKDCPGGRGVIGALRSLRGGAAHKFLDVPRAWKTPQGRGWKDGQGEAYLKMLSASPHVTITPYVPPEPPSEDDVARYIASNSRACYRDLVTGMIPMLSLASAPLRKFAHDAALAARPTCGADCDGRCPVSRRPSV